jgi:acyl-CoA reductase-like NAD-dependent aldehyde dehydrogenase
VLPPAPGIPVQTTVAYQPIGVVTVIVPFNWPIAILAAALPHALLAGNTAIVKPPPTTPLATTRLVQRVAEKLPPGVLNVITGRDSEMTGLIDNADVAKVCFTGSVNGGKRIMEMAARSLTQEQFGPVVPVIPYDDDDEAVRMANDTWAGLGASVWTADTDTATRLGGQLECGYVWVNDHGANRPDLRAPFGGMRHSGMGREQDIEGVRAFQDTRSITHTANETQQAAH